MTKKVTVLIRENGQLIQSKQTEEEKKTDDEQLQHDEEAAALDAPNETSKFKLIESKPSIKTKKTTFQLLKPLLITIISAVLIGSLLGLIMLRMFGGFGGGVEDSPAAPVSSSPNNAADGPDERQSFTLDPIQVFILQGGVFSEESNASDWQTRLSEAGMPSMLWARDDQTFLLGGLAKTKEAGKEIAEQFPELDLYVKEWSVPGAELEGVPEEKAWLESFRAEWEESVEQIEVTGSFQLDGWQRLIEQAPENSASLNSLIDAVRNFDEREGLEGRLQLLQLLHVYENVIGSN